MGYGYLEQATTQLFIPALYGFTKILPRDQTIFHHFVWHLPNTGIFYSENRLKFREKGLFQTGLNGFRKIKV
jgi:hypothetical protein